jgi:predicted GNAT family acetyltransferase
MLCGLTDDVDVFLGAAREYLTSRPVEHNLVLSLAEANRTEPRPSRWAWVTDRRRVVGALCQAPSDHLASVTPMPAAAVEAMVERLSQEDLTLPGVNGEAGTVARFAGGWATARSVPAHPAAGQRIYELGRLRLPGGVAGRLRRATATDVELIVEWDGAMATEVELGRPVSEDRRSRISVRVGDGRFWLWDVDGEPVSMAYTTPILAGAVRIGAVYTPPERRAAGFASASMGAISAELLAAGVTSCLLYTQLANPFSNRLYQRLGYRPVAEVLVYRFGD